MSDNERKKQFPFSDFEARWREHWDAQKTFKCAGPGDTGFDAAKPKYYALDMFPYPSGKGLHVGHPEGYTASDIVSRYKRKNGFNVLHPMGWDAFGLPAEQYAIRTGTHPRVATVENIKRFTSQLKNIGFSYDWDRQVDTTDPEFFKWTQWIFLQIYNSWFDPEAKAARPIAELEDARKKSHPDESNTDFHDFIDSKRLAYVSEVPVNWCPELGTVLANEEVIDGKSEVGDYPVERRPMRQWIMRITAYGDRLADELEGLDWPEGIKMLQRNWIGRSEGAEVVFEIDGTKESVTVYTTRPDTLFGATYMVLAPEHPLVAQVTSSAQTKEVEAYCAGVANKSDLERTELAKDKTGVFTGGYAINPVNDEKIPIWIADYVLISYGTGAIMAVPAHDSRDNAFAKKFEIPIIEVVQAPADNDETCFTGNGIAINSPLIDGLETTEAKEKITAWLEEKSKGSKAVNYKLRDWLFSRQRYWGEPFPIIWEDGRHKAIPDSELPLEPPELDDYKPTGDGEPPLARAEDWVKYSEKARRETNTMPQWAGSSWYFMRYCDPQCADRFIGKKEEAYWMGGGDQAGSVDLYIGGTEHAVLHLLYARFWHKVLYDLGYLSKKEPFQKLVNQGMILGEDGRKMSKRWGNVVDPDDVIDEFGADSLRLFEMFMGPLDQVKPWSKKGVEGVYRFLGRVWRLFMEEDGDGWKVSDQVQETESTKEALKVLHQTIKKVTADTEALAFNTAIAEMMKFTKEYTAYEVRPLGSLIAFLNILTPYAPFISEEIYAHLQKKFPSLGSEELYHQGWPEFDEKFLIEDEIELVVQVNGKKRDQIKVALDAPNDEIEKLALALEKVAEFTEGKTVRKVIVVPKRLVNIVAN